MRKFMAATMAVAALAAAPSIARAQPVEGKAPPSLGSNIDVVQGDPFTSLKDLKGHSIRLVFFATW